jgi:hypothetical protein
MGDGMKPVFEGTDGHGFEAKPSNGDFPSR